MELTDIDNLVALQRNYFNIGKTRSLAVRLTHLKALYEGITKYESKIMEALKKDLNKSEFDSYATEIGYTLKEISHTIKHLPKWERCEKIRKTPLYLFGTKSYVMNEPYGVTLHIAPWNYPFQLAIVPIIGALAAGNTVILKPSELTPNVSDLLTELISEIFPKELIAVLTGGKEVSEKLLEQKFDYIFFTGSTRVGKIIMEAAAKQLTPVTLELGGKSPTIVHEDANLQLAARRIAYGKFLNAGQTCVAPDYVYVHEKIKNTFLQQLKQEITELYGENPVENSKMTRIVSKKHFERLVKLFENVVPIIGGKFNEETLMISPTVLTDVTWEMPVMEEEIFGPILPVMTYKEVDEIVEKITNKPKPLALYLFTESKAIKEEILSRISFGGGCINDTILHLTHPHLPFGGVGESGIGRYHGKYSFETFTHQKSIMKQTTKFDISVRYGLSEKAYKMVRKTLK